MADSAFDFNQAPSNTAGRQFGTVASLAKLAGLGKKSGGMSARDHSNLMRQQAGHAIDAQLVGHVLGQEASKQTHKQTMQANRLQNKQAKTMAEVNNAHELAKSEQAHTQASDMHTLGMNAIHSLSNNPKVAGFKLPSGTSAQFNGVSEAQA